MTTDQPSVDAMGPRARRELLARLLRARATGSGEAFNLSVGQEALWFVQELATDTAAYNVAFCGRVRSEVDPKRLEAALLRLIYRHPMLRCTFEVSAEGPRQRIGSIPDRCLEIIDASGCTEENLKIQVRDSYCRPFDLRNGPVFRASLFRLHSADHVLLITAHHIVFDAWSLGIIVSELLALYDSLGSADPLPLPQASYLDFVKWQRSVVDSEKGREAWDYWRSQLDGVSLSSELPTDYRRPDTQSFRGTASHFDLGSSLFERLRRFARDENCTPFTVLAATLHALLYRYTGSNKIPIGALLAGRSCPGTESAVGYFVNPVVLCATVQAETTFRQHVAHVREVVIGAQQHGDFPFPEIVKRLQPVRDPSRTPLFQVMLNSVKASKIGLPGDMEHPRDGASVHLGSLVLESFPFSQQEGQFDLDLTLVDTGEGISALLKYRTDLFEPGTIERLTQHFTELLSAAISEPDRRITELPLLTDRERTRVLREWNATERAYPETTISRLIEDQVRRTPDATALMFNGRMMTYRELNGRANQLARHLRSMGVGPEVLVGICMERSFELVVGLLGILKTGAAYVPVDPAYPTDRQTYMIEDSCAPVLLTEANLAGRLSATRTRLVCLDTGWEEVSRQPEDDLEDGPDPDNLAYVIYTSGSTGKPKGAMNAHRAVCNRLLWMQDTYQLKDSDRVLQKTPFSFDVSVWEFFWPLITGARLVIAIPEGHKDPAYLVRLIQEQAITTVHFVPSMLQAFLEAENVTECSALRRVLCSGEALPYELQQRFFGLLDVELHNLYGPTEAAVDVTYWTCQRTGERRIVPIGRPVANTRIYILDSHSQPVPVGVAGELYIGGVQVGRGYWGRPDLTEERFMPDPFHSPGRMYRTGDLARWLPDGVVEYLGRMDHQVKIRGFRIELGEIEAELLQDVRVKQAAVVAREDMPGDQKLVAYLTTHDGEPLNPTALKASLSKQLPDFMTPSAFVCLDAFPLSPNGKVDRKALPAPDTSRPLLAAPYEAPRTEVESALVGIWKEALCVETVGIHDNFFDLGGHSLLMLRVHARIESQLSRRLPVVKLFQYPTIEALSRHLTLGEDISAERARILNQANRRRNAMRQLRDFKDRKEARS